MTGLIPDDLALIIIGGQNPYRQRLFTIKPDHECGVDCRPFHYARWCHLDYTDAELADRRTPLPWLETP